MWRRAWSSRSIAVSSVGSARFSSSANVSPSSPASPSSSVESTSQPFAPLYDSLREGLTLLPEASVLSLRGEHAFKFLQGLSTNDINRILHFPSPSSSGKGGGGSPGLYTLFLSNRGRTLFDAMVMVDRFSMPSLFPSPRIRETSSPEAASPVSPPLSAPPNEHAFLIQTHRRLAELLFKHLQQYKLRNKITLTDVSHQYSVWQVMSVNPDQLHKIVLHNNEQPDAIAFMDPRLPRLGARMVLPKTIAPIVPDSYQFVPPEYYDALRIFYGVPEVAIDAEFEKSLPLEYNFDWLNAISFTKGCYLGQELTMRTHTQGQIRKRVMPYYLTVMTEQERAVGPLQVEAPGSPALRIGPQTPHLMKMSVTYSTSPDLPHGHRTWTENLLFPSAIIDSSFRVAEDIAKAASGEHFTMAGKAIGAPTAPPLCNIGLATLRLDNVLSPQSIVKWRDYRVHPYIPYWWPESVDHVDNIQ